METGGVLSPDSSPATPPSTPGAPLFGTYKSERSLSLRKSSLLKTCHSLEPTTCSLPYPPVSLSRKVGAEFIGTMILLFGGTATAIVNQKTGGSVTLIGCAAASGLAVMTVILATGHISGAHLNPALTIAFAALGRFPWKHVPVYIAAQVMASLIVAFGLKIIFNPMMGGGVTVPSGDNYGQAFALEFIISFNLMFVVTAVATDTRAVGELAAIAVGATVMLNILIAGQISGASMNPVRTLGPAIASGNFKGIWIYFTAPILGALLGAGVYSAVRLSDEEEAEYHEKASVHNYSFRK